MSPHPTPTPTPYNIVLRTGAHLRRPAGGMALAMRSTTMIHADETSMGPGGARAWVRMFLDTATGSTLSAIRPGRGGGAPGEVPGEGRDGIIV